MSASPRRVAQRNHGIQRRPDPTGVTYQGGEGFYRILQHGKHVGAVVQGYQNWTAQPEQFDGWAWTAPTRRQAVAALIAWLEQQP